MSAILASLAGLLRLRGRPVSPQRLSANLPGGFTPPGVEECLRSAALAGVQTRLARAPLREIPAPALPCLLVLRPQARTGAAAPRGQAGGPASAQANPGQTNPGRATSAAPPAPAQASPQNNAPVVPQPKPPAEPQAELGACILLRLDREKKLAEAVFPDTEPKSVTLPLDKLEAAYTGQAVFLPRAEPKSDARTESLSLTRPRHWFWGTIKEFSPIYRDVALASLVINLLTLASPLFIMNVYDRVVPNDAVYTLWVLVIGLMIAHFMDFVLRNLRGRFVDTAGRNADVIVTSLLMDRILHMRLDSKPESTGGLVNNLREFEQVRDFFGSTTLLALFDLPFLFIFVLVVAFIGGPMVILVLVALPLMLCFVWLIQIPFQRSLDRQFKQNIQKNSLLVEIVAGLETVKSILAQGQMKRQWEEVVDAAAAESARSRGLASLAQTGSLFITYLINAGVIIMGVYLISAERMTQGGLIACVILVSRSLGPFMQIAAMLTQMQKSRIALRALEQIVRLPSEEAGERASDSKGLEADLLLSGVSFRYPRSAVTALKDVNLRIKSGEKVGIVGATGSGKSTLARLLVGLYQPEDGNVSFGGVDIRQLDPADLRTRVGFMPQENYLFYGSVRENIALGRPWTDMKEVVRAAQLSGAAEFVRRHPQGYDMPVGERGQALSGGQRQSVALARTLVRDPEVLILDEPSSNLDMAGEYRLMLRLKNLIRNRTLIILTHRPSLLALVDRVVVMQGGTILADGPREAVLAAMREGKLKGGGLHV